MTSSSSHNNIEPITNKPHNSIGPKLGYSNIISNNNTSLIQNNNKSNFKSNLPHNPPENSPATLSNFIENKAESSKQTPQHLFLLLKSYPEEINWCAHLLLFLFIPATLLVKSDEKENLVDRFSKITDENIKRISDFLNKSYENTIPSSNLSPKNLQNALENGNLSQKFSK
jgi:hypothetical protein